MRKKDHVASKAASQPTSASNANSYVFSNNTIYIYMLHMVRYSGQASIEHKELYVQEDQKKGEKKETLCTISAFFSFSQSLFWFLSNENFPGLLSNLIDKRNPSFEWKQ